MKSNIYSRLLMAPLLALLAVACSPNQFNQSTEYDDVYYTSSDRNTQKTVKKQTTSTLLVAQQKQATVDNYSTENVNAQLVNKYNNGQPGQVTYFEDGPLIKTAQDLNYDDFVIDYQNEQLAYYDLPLDWDQDWNRASFNDLINQDFYFRLAWYDQYYLGRSFRMTQYMTGRSGRFRSNRLNNFGPRVGIGFGVGFNNFYMGFNNMAFVDLNPWGFNDPFWRPINRWGWSNRGWNNWGWGGFNDPFWCPPFYNSANSWGWRGGWRNNVFVNNNVYFDRRADRILATNSRSQQDVRRGPRVGTSRIATVRNEAINGSAPATRSSRYTDNLNNGSSASRNGRAGISTSAGRANTSSRLGTSSSSRSGASSSSRAGLNNTSRSGLSTNSTNNRVRTDAYRFNDTNSRSRSSRSSAVRNNGSGSISRGNSSGTRASSRSSAGSYSRSSARPGTSSRSSSPSFNRSSSSSRSSYGSSSRGSSSSRSGYSRGSSSRSSGSSSRSSSYSRGSSSRSSGSSSRSSYSRSSGSSSRSSGSVSRGSSSSSSSGSSRSSGSSSSRSSSSSSSRSGRGN